MSEEIEYYYCKNYCQRNRFLKASDAKSMRNRCDQCLECPNCSVALTKKTSDNKHLYGCNYCNWESSNIKFITKEEHDLNGLIYQLKCSNAKGYLEKNYSSTLNKLKSNEEFNKKLNSRKDSLYSSSLSNTLNRYNNESMLSSNMNDESMLFNRIEELKKKDKIWEFENLENKLKTDFNEKLKLNNDFDYDDNYLADYKNNLAFQAVGNFLICNLDYLEKGLNKVDSLDTLKDKLKYDYDVSILSSVEQRNNNLMSQYPKAQ